MTYKIDIINNAFRRLRITGVLTTDPSPVEVENAMNMLETMAYEYAGRNICVGYNFEDEPDTSSIHNISRKYWYAFETGLAMRLITDYGKEIPNSLLMNHNAAFSFLVGDTAVRQEVAYPSRMPLGRGNRWRWHGHRFYTTPVYPDPDCEMATSMYINDIKEFKESFADYLEDLEEITSYTLDVDSGLEIISESLSSPDITYKIKALTEGIQNIKIIGTAQIIDYEPLTDGTFHANYLSSIDAAWGSGSFTGTGYFGAAIDGDGNLDLTGGIVKYVSYSGVGNVPNGDVGCVRIKFIPNYTGVPSADVAIFSSDNASTGASLIYIYHDTAGNLNASFYTSAAVLIGTISSAFSPTSGTSYEIEFNWDFDTGNTQMFVDGTSVGSDLSLATTGSRTTLFVGADNAATVATDCYIDEITIFSTVQHVSDYTISTTPTRVQTRLREINVIEVPI